MSSENKTLKLLQTEKNLNFKTLNDIDDKYENNYLIQYHLGCYYEKSNDILLTIKHFNNAIQLNSIFSPPYIKLLNFTQNPLEMYNIIGPIFCKETLNSSGKKCLNLQENSYICSIVGPKLKENDFDVFCYELYKTLYNCINSSSPKKMDINVIQTWKIISTELGNLSFKLDPFESIYYFQQGLENEKIKKAIKNSGKTFENFDRQLILSYILSKNYTTTPEKYPIKVSLDKFFGVVPYKGTKIFNEKIRVGYLSPDFNKNAVGLFSTVLLKYSKNIEVYVYYTKKSEDHFTQIFKMYTQNWFDISSYSDKQAYDLIKNRHNIDILVDLISVGIDNRLGLVSMSPAPIIVNYLGFPDTSGVGCYTHRISDKMMDTNPKNTFSEKMIFMPRNFICYKLWENVSTPKINYKIPSKKRLRIGILNKLSKQNKHFVKTLKTITEERSDVVICIKCGTDEELHRKIYSEVKNVVFLPFQEKIESYFNLFNSVDILIDTFPYSGTTTTCSGLFMGVPSYCIYNVSNTHCSNVTGGFNLHLHEQNSNFGFDNYNCKNEKELINKIVNLDFEPEKEQEKRKIIRNEFNKLMDPEKFNKEYEELLCSLVQ